MLLPERIQTVQKLIKGTFSNELFGSLIELKRSHRVLHTVVYILLHVPLEDVVGQETQGDVARVILMIDLDSINDLARRNEHIDS